MNVLTVGTTVYYTDNAGRIYETKISQIIYDTNSGSFAFNEHAIGKSIFLSREEAEKALKESEKE